MLMYKIGLLLGLSSIISIGAQNLFVIKQGLKNEYPYLCAFSCFLCDFILITLGTLGISHVISEYPVLRLALLVAGILLLMIYGTSAIKRGFNSMAIQHNLLGLAVEQYSNSSISKLLGLGLSFSILNPQAILDSMVIIGGSANHYAGQMKYLFVLGAITASFIWFFGLALLTSCFAKQIMVVKIWCAVEFTSGIMMLYFAIKFLLPLL